MDKTEFLLLFLFMKFFSDSFAYLECVNNNSLANPSYELYCRSKKSSYISQNYTDKIHKSNFGNKILKLLKQFNIFFSENFLHKTNRWDIAI